MRLRSGNGSIWFLIFGVLAAGVAAWWTWTAQRTALRTVDVVVATHDVLPLSEVLPDDVRLAAVPVPAVPSDAVRNTASVVGQYVRYGMIHGQVVRAANLAATQPGTSRTDAEIAMTAADSPSVRAVAVALQADTGLDLPTPGDHVDVLAVVHDQGDTQARVLASNVLVLDRLTTGASASGQAAGPEPVAQAGALVLALTVVQAEQVALAQTVGQVQVLLDPLGTRVSMSPAPPLDAGQWLASRGS
jgi:Flp pilus assembly protein CpaB